MPLNTREQLHQQIDSLPDHLIDQIAKFTQILTAKQEMLEYSDWESGQWQEFSLAQFFSEDDEIAYCIEDAQEIVKLC
ncbi:MAG: hypothetical protein M1G31_10565 [Pseudanabaena sp. Salubria-1]|uniref:hypothetical protein n=1 Tax=Pseudanabaena sp. lw0831 TaxID=1357935 RepID=UPI0019169370|nr:hypothetical protein [Pseudanabaena sp. lw0831]MCL1491179.1 hypothetical protein [Pseudanabaena sp. Salubria-1]GBO51610.1 hypothetical protein APA_851 [Pseudanabaena sp. lw0831]